MLAPSGYVGRALRTNYQTQGFFIAFGLFGVGPGFARQLMPGRRWSRERTIIAKPPPVHARGGG